MLNSILRTCILLARHACSLNVYTTIYLTYTEHVIFSASLAQILLTAFEGVQMVRTA